LILPVADDEEDPDQAGEYQAQDDVVRPTEVHDQPFLSVPGAGVKLNEIEHVSRPTPG
jgi:hypothetical protein